MRQPAGCSTSADRAAAAAGATLSVTGGVQRQRLLGERARQRHGELAKRVGELCAVGGKRLIERGNQQAQMVNLGLGRLARGRLTFFAAALITLVPGGLLQGFKVRGGGGRLAGRTRVGTVELRRLPVVDLLGAVGAEGRCGLTHTKSSRLLPN